MGCLVEGPRAQATTLIFADFDNTLLETRKQFEGTFKTPYVLFRIDHRTNVLERTLEGPREIEVTPVDFEHIRRYLYHPDGDIENRNRLVTLESGEKIRPGQYMLVFPDSYKYFFDGDKGENHLLQAFQKTYSRNSQSGWQGPFWQHFTKIMGQEDTARGVRIITARKHSGKNWDAFFKYLVRNKELSRIPNSAFFHNVSHESYDQFSLTHDIAERKAQLLLQAVINLGRVPLRPEDMRLNPDGTGTELSHYVIFADDSQETLERVLPLFQDIVRTKRVPVKIGIFNMGLATAIRDSGRPQYTIIKSDGTFRTATETEMNGEPLLLRNSLIKPQPAVPTPCFEQVVIPSSALSGDQL